MLSSGPPGRETPGFRELVFSDFRRYRDEEPSWVKVLARCLVLPGLIACIILRAQQCLFWSGHKRPAEMLRTLGVILVGSDFTPGMQIGTGLLMPHPVGITMGNTVVIGNDVAIAQGVTIGARVPHAHAEDQVFPRIGDGAILLSNATIVGDVRVGCHAQVGANTLVVNDVPDRAIVVGVPARKIGERDPADIGG